ncbi:MAG: hypothetical protein ABSF90_24725 [Syntrophobacteraceae bacterium]|jgi:hypothetical protein
MSRWISNLVSRMKDSLRNKLGRAEPSLKNNVPSLKKNDSPIPTVDLSRRVIGDLSRNVREGLLARIEIRLTRWSIILLAVIAIIYILPHIRELFEPAKSPSVTPQANSESEYQKKTTSQKPEGPRPESAQSASVKMEQPGNLIDPEFSITLLEKDQSSGLRLCIVNKNPSSTSFLRTGDIFKIIFPPESGQIRLIPNSVAVNSSTLSPTDFQATVNSDQIHLTYIGYDKKFPSWDSCCFDVTLYSFNGSKSGYVQFIPSGAGILKTPPVHLLLPSAIISNNVSKPRTINFEDDYKRYISPYYPSKPHKKLAKNNSKKQKAKPVTKSEYHRKNGTHVKHRSAPKKSAKDKKKANKRQHS